MKIKDWEDSVNTNLNGAFYVLNSFIEVALHPISRITANMDKKIIIYNSLFYQFINDWFIFRTQT